MRRVLAAEDGAGLGHHLLDERVADPGADRLAAVLADHLGHGLRADQVVRIVAPGCFASMPAASMAVVVEPDRPRPCSSTRNTRSASPSKARPTSAPTLRDPGLRGRAGSRAGSGRPGGSGTCRRARRKSTSRSNGRLVEHPGNDQAAHAVGGVGHDLERLQRAHVDERAHVVGELVEQVDRRLGATCGPRCRRRSAALRSSGLDLVEAGVHADRPGPARHSLMPLYCAGLCDAVNMAPGASSCPRRSRRGRSTPGRGRRRRRPATHTFGERGRRARPRSAACRAPIRMRGRAGEAGERGADGVGTIVGVELVGHGAPDVVGLEDRVELLGVITGYEDRACPTHATAPSRRRPRTSLARMKRPRARLPIAARSSTSSSVGVSGSHPSEPFHSSQVSHSTGRALVRVAAAPPAAGDREDERPAAARATQRRRCRATTGSTRCSSTGVWP